jgi:tetratricopeptide (TPR) repeat protein
MFQLSDEEVRAIRKNGDALERAGRISEAIALYEYGVTQGTRSQGIYRSLVVLYNKAKRYQDGRRLCELAVKLWPVSRDTHGHVVPSFFASRLARKLSDEEELQINLDGRTLEKAGRIDEAIARYEYGVANETRATGTYERLLTLYRKVNRFEDERRLCEHAANQWPTARNRHGHVLPSSFASRLSSINARRGRGAKE